MIAEQQNLMLIDQASKNDIECIVKPEKDVVELKVKDITCFVRMDDIYALALLILKPDQKDSLLPVQQTTIRKYFKQHRVKVKKDIKKGQDLVVNCEIDVPLMIEQNIKAFLNSNKIIV